MNPTLDNKASDVIVEPNLMPYQHLPFNGDTFILNEFLSLKNKFNVEYCIETGTCLGYTTQWMAKNFNKVFTIEINEHYHKIAKHKLVNALNTELLLGNSSELLSSILKKVNNKTIIFLDAHWNDFCPLQDELKIINESGLNPIIAIHDFLVPNNHTLGYDVYHGQPFNFEWLKKFFDNIYNENNYDYYYNSDEKSEGAKRGIIYLTPKI